MLNALCKCKYIVHKQWPNDTNGLNMSTNLVISDLIECEKYISIKLLFRTMMIDQ